MNKTWCGTLLTLLIVIGCGSTPRVEAPPAGPTEGQVTGLSEDPQADDTADETIANTLKWTTASEVDNFGFDIYRSLDEDGPFEKITEQPLPGAGTTDEPQQYVFVDEDIDPGTDYYYYIESISLGGVREKFSPTIKAPAKRPEAGKD